MANFRRVLEFDKFAGEWPLLKKIASTNPIDCKNSPNFTVMFQTLLCEYELVCLKTASCLVERDDNE